MRLPRALLLLLAAACAACAAPQPAPQGRPIAPPPSAAPAPAPTPTAPLPPPEPALDPAEARISAKEVLEKAGLETYSNNDDALKRALELGFDETRTRRVAAALAKSCLDAQDRNAKACAEPFESLSNPSLPDETLEKLLTYLGRIAETKGYTPSMRLLVRLHALGSIRAGMEVETILARRMTSRLATHACSPPTEAEVAASAASLVDFVVVEGASSSNPKAGRALRKPTPTELADLAYFYAAAVAGSGAVVAGAGWEEDKKAPRLADDAPEIVGRAAIAKGMQRALARGELATHAALARQYLASLGYPGKIRVAQESDQRWGGPGYAYVMRALAQSAEILGELDEAETLYRRANPGGGFCGTSVASVRADQIEGVIRTVEEARGCRAVIAERLFSVTYDETIYGTPRLTAAGFDVARLYRGALVTLGRSDVAALEQLFRADAQLGPVALARLGTRGQEAWAEQVRAIPGYAAEGKARAIPQLVALTRGGVGIDRVAAVDALGSLLEDHGQDPCLHFGGWGSHSANGERNVRALSHECATKLPPAEVETIVKLLTGLASDPRPELRQAVAVALGRTGMSSARPPLKTLSRDPHTIVGSQTCIRAADGTEKCGPTQPVRQAAENGLTRIQEAEARRVQERARVRTK